MHRRDFVTLLGGARPGVSATLTTTAFDRSSLRWLEISTDLSSARAHHIGSRATATNEIVASIHPKAILTTDEERGRPRLV
jgi:hypothetical protein